MALKLVTPAASLVVSVAEAKAHLRVNTSDDDALIETLIKAATDHVEGPNGFTGRALLDQTWDFFADAFPSESGPLKLPLPPLIEVVGVFYNDTDEVEQEFDVGDYEIDQSSEPARIYLPSSGSWPTVTSALSAVRIRFRAGYLKPVSPAESDVPYAIKAAILMMVGTLYEHRETIVIGQTAMILPWAAEQLLRPYRVHTAMA